MKWNSARVVLFLLLCVTLSCADANVVRQEDGTKRVDLPQGKKLVSVSHDHGDTWSLVRSAKPGEVPETLEYYHNSEVGGWKRAKIIFVEH